MNGAERPPWIGIVIGGAERDRTDDLLSAIQALSQLSYSPTLCIWKATARNGPPPGEIPGRADYRGGGGRAPGVPARDELPEWRGGGGGRGRTPPRRAH